MRFFLLFLCFLMSALVQAQSDPGKVWRHNVVVSVGNIKSVIVAPYRGESWSSFIPYYAGRYYYQTNKRWLQFGAGFEFLPNSLTDKWHSFYEHSERYDQLIGAGIYVRFVARPARWLSLFSETGLQGMRLQSYVNNYRTNSSDGLRRIYLYGPSIGFGATVCIAGHFLVELRTPVAHAALLQYTTNDPYHTFNSFRRIPLVYLPATLGIGCKF